MFKKKDALFLALLLSAFHVNAEQATSINNYLLSGSDQLYIAALKSDTDSSSDWSSSWLDTAEVRLQHEEDERDNNSETYRLRVKPKYGAEREAEKSFVTTSTQQRNLVVDEVFSLELMARYENIVRIVSLQFKLDYLQDKLDLLKVEINAERALNNSVEFRADKLQGFVLDYDNARTKQVLLKKRFEAQIKKILVSKNTNDTFFSNLIKPDQIQSIIKQHQEQFTSVKSMPLVQMAKLEQDIADSRLKLYQSQRGFGVELLEVKYEDKKNSAIGFTVGFRLPTGNDAKSVGRYLDVSEAGSKYQRVSHRVERNITDILEEISWDLDTWKSGKTSIKKVNTLLLQPSRSSNAALVTGLRSQLLSLNKDNNVAHVRLLKNYIELLHMSGLLTRTPLKNWLNQSNTELAFN